MGCGIGYGYLHRIPVDGLVEAPPVVEQQQATIPPNGQMVQVPLSTPVPAAAAAAIVPPTLAPQATTHVPGGAVPQALPTLTTSAGLPSLTSTTLPTIGSVPSYTPAPLSTAVPSKSFEAFSVVSNLKHFQLSHQHRLCRWCHLFRHPHSLRQVFFSC